MATVNDLKIKLSEKNIPVLHENNMLGIQLAKHCWTWFNVLADGSLLFDHTYSQNTGASKKGISHRLKKYAQLEKLTGIHNYSIFD